MAVHSLISIPRPCSESWATMTPTAQGRHCAACATEVVDFTRLSEAEILAFLSAPRGCAPVCIVAHTSQVAAAPGASGSRWRRWLVAGLALLGWHPLAASAADTPQVPPAPPALAAADPAAHKQLIIRGQVTDGENGRPVRGMFLFINDTQYGATTDEAGRFELVLGAQWPPVQAGTLTLRVQGQPFEFKAQEVRVNLRAPQPIEVHITLQSVEGRGRIMGKPYLPKRPVKPPRS
ncbi:carboxypeptidase regulatory-like domain-containing protein [Hymenobacter ruricola]|uniref:Carboxypeptidase-like regulatory domain-containing protein n=1 Tax=Hymenobacter ruricola TaxID=2791023 RepID=A0ABS0I7L1_9BACT|nr:carboxypeptidase regulatory-like domain-containing protein [Hymenobacter ruricola]MBF9222874.1 carboxypeptidase-like regulatory domain-containing protein [Hymenobacter ruricola]